MPKHILKFKKLFYLLSMTGFALILSGCGTMIRYRKVTLEVMAEKIEAIEIKKPVARFRIGEKLTYYIYWRGIPVGIATTHVKDIVSVNNRQAYHLVGTARSNSYLFLIFRVDNFMESFVDKETLLPLRHIVKRSEGRYRAHISLDYDWEKRQLSFHNLTDGTRKIFPLPEKTEDQFSAFYYLRTLEFYSFEPAIFFVNQGEKNWKIETPVESVGKISLPRLGTFDAFVIEPVPYFDGKPSDKGKVWIWLSNDEKRIPLMIKLHVNVRFLGVVVAVLQDIE